MKKILLGITISLLLTSIGYCQKQTPQFTIESDKEYSADGQLRFEKTFYPNGELMQEIPYRDGKREGTRKWYYENGYLQSELFYENGKPVGMWRWYYENGNLQSEMFWGDGVLKWVREYDANGNLTKEILWEDGKVETQKYK